MKNLPPDNIKLTPKEIREISIYLPKPINTENIGNTKFEIYLAKKLFKPQWDDQILRRLVVEARKTYKEYYGDDINEINLYDDKSAVYLVCTSYNYRNPQGKEFPVKEWFSLRFIPATGEPTMNEDLNFYIFNDDLKKYSLLEIFRQRLKPFLKLSDTQIMERLITLSRFCAIRPYPSLNGNEGLKNNKHSTISFALMNRQFLLDIVNMRLNIQFMTCQVHTHMSDKLLTYSANKQIRSFPFTHAYKQLDLLPNFIRISRNKKGVYAYKFPGYFLSLKNLVNTLEFLSQQNKLPINIIKEYLDKEIDFIKILNNPKIYHFRKMGELFTKNGKIPGTNLTGEELRNLLDKNVEDGPTLRIMEIESWKKGVEDMIKFAKLHG